jgi:uracil-DNA glycosylase
MNSVESLHQHIRACRLCEEAGYIDRATPVVSDSLGGRMMLIGQAPGEVELSVRRPFMGKAGKELFRWMRSIGIEEEEFRGRVYITSITRCFPGKARSGAGDRRPSQAEIALCRPWLEQQLALVEPSVILLVGGLAIERYFPRQALADLIGQRFDQDGRIVIPLPHPSGASRWLNAPEHKELLRQALCHVRAEWTRLFA